MDLRIRKAVTRHGARLIRVGDHASPAFVPERRASSVADIPEEAFLVERLAVAWDGVDTALFAAFSKRVAPFVEQGKLRVFGYVASEQANARGADMLGMAPRSGGLDTRGMFDYARKGMLRVLCLFGVNPLLRYADGALASDAIEKAPFVVVSELFMTQTAQRANLVLPARAAFEKDGHTTNITGEVLPLTATLTPLQETLSDGEMLVALAAELGIEVPMPAAIRAIACAPSRAPKSVEEGRTEIHLATATAADASVRIAIAASPFSGGGTLAFDDRLEALREKATATFSATSARELGVCEGDVVDVAAGARALRGLVVRVREDAVDGTVTVVDGLAGAPANVFFEGEAVTVQNRRSSRPELAGI
jgi:hypothetical protein